MTDEQRPDGRRFGDSSGKFHPNMGDTVERYRDRLADLPGEELSPAFSPVEPVERPDPHNAFVSTFEPKAVDVGPLSGLVLAIKDNLAVRGATMTAGTDAFAYEPGRDAAAVERLRSAGAAIAGTTNMDPFALGTSGEWSAHGRTENPAARGHVPGGSSSGSAAAVACGAVDAALGTDTGGSVRLPAAFCGLVGLKPTYDLLPRAGVLDLSPSNDHVGVLAADVETAARVLRTVAGGAPVRPEDGPVPEAGSAGPTPSSPTDPGELTVGLPEEAFDVPTPAVEARVREALESAAGELGADLAAVRLPEHGDAAFVNDAQTVMEFAALLERDGNPIGTGRPADLRAAMRALRREGSDLPERVRRLAGLGTELLSSGADHYGRTWDARRRLVHRTRSLFREVDVLATPTAPMPPPRFGEVGSSVSVRETLRNTAPFNLTGQPAVTLPCGDVDGLPVGLQLVMPRCADGELLGVAGLFEDVLRD